MDETCVYVEYDTDNVCDARTDRVLGRADASLVSSSAAVEDDYAQGCVMAYVGVDGFWHFLRYLQRDEARAVFEAVDASR